MRIRINTSVILRIPAHTKWYLTWQGQTTSSCSNTTTSKCASSKTIFGLVQFLQNTHSQFFVGWRRYCKLAMTFHLWYCAITAVFYRPSQNLSWCHLYIVSYNIRRNSSLVFRVTLLKARVLSVSLRRPRHLKIEDLHW